MRAVVQRVSSARVMEGDRILGSIGKGLVVFLGISKDDGPSDADYILKKILTLRIFEDDRGKMNLSVTEVGGEILIISQFTLYADCRKGRRPSFTDAAPPEAAKEIYEKFIEMAKMSNIKVASGRFQAKMEVYLVNSGPVTILLDSSKGF